MFSREENMVSTIKPPITAIQRGIGTGMGKINTRNRGINTGLRSVLRNLGSKMELIDIGANLTHSSFRHDLVEVIENASQAGVRTIIVTGASDEGNRQALELAKRYPGQLYATAGVHHTMPLNIAMPVAN